MTSPAGASARLSKVGKLSQEGVVHGDDAVDLRLLQHDLRHEDGVAVGRLAPRQPPPRRVKPRQQRGLHLRNGLLHNVHARRPSNPQGYRPSVGVDTGSRHNGADRPPSFHLSLLPRSP